MTPEARLHTLMQRALTRHLNHYTAHAVIVDVIKEALLERLAYIRLDPKHIIDLGSGVGTFTQALSQRFPQAAVWAIDCHPHMSRHCAQNGVKALTANAYHLPFPDHSIDAVFAHLLLPFLMDYPALWQECRRVLAPGGLLLFSSLGPNTLCELRASFAAVDSYPHINSFVDLHHIGDSLVEAAMLDPVLDVEHFQLSYPSLSALLHELQALGSIKFLEKDTQGYFGKARWHQVAQHYQTHYSDAKQRLLVSVEASFGHAFSPLKAPQRLENDGSIAITLDAIQRRPHEPSN